MHYYKIKTATVKIYKIHKIVILDAPLLPAQLTYRT